MSQNNKNNSRIFKVRPVHEILPGRGQNNRGLNRPQPNILMQPKNPHPGFQQQQQPQQQQQQQQQQQVNFRNCNLINTYSGLLNVLTLLMATVNIAIIGYNFSYYKVIRTFF
jgi:hypothetical protein